MEGAERSACQRELEAGGQLAIVRKDQTFRVFQLCRPPGFCCAALGVSLAFLCSSGFTLDLQLQFFRFIDRGI